MATVLYARVSSTEQTIEHQRTQAEQAGFKFDEIISDGGVSGVSTKLRERPQGRRLFDLLRSGDTLVRDALIAFMAATAQAQAEATKEAQRAGIAHAKANGDARAYKGRKPSYSRKQFESAQAMLGKSASVGEIARSTGLTRQTVYRIKDDPAGAEAALAIWGVR
jgi:DNA invertase Pin-like site-specific DNA recombinase